jgi:hypothetical protein
LTVESVIYDSAKLQWVVSAYYEPNMKDTIALLYISKTGAPPYPTFVQDTFSVSKNPCTLSSSVCCLNTLAQNYMIGPFSQNITDKIGACGNDIQQTKTNTLFDTSKSSYWINHLMDSYPNSVVKRLAVDHVNIYINTYDLRDQFSMKNDIVGGYTMTFFVGMVYLTMLPTNAIVSSASQTKIVVTSTNALTFSFTSEQEYTFVQYVSMSVIQNKWVENMLLVRRPQTVKVSIVLPDSVRQNMKTGLVPLTSIRFAIGQTIPPMQDTVSWINPCISSTLTGMWDNLDLRSMYHNASAQDCAQSSNMCSNPMTEILQSGLVDFYFPIGDEAINVLHISSPGKYKLFVYMDVSVVDISGVQSFTKLVLQAPITATSVARQCDFLQGAHSLKDIVNIDLAVGITGSLSDWQVDVAETNNILSSPIQTANSNSKSIESSLITMVLKCDTAVMANSLTSQYHIEVDDLVSYAHTHLLSLTNIYTCTVLQISSAYEISQSYKCVPQVTIHFLDTMKYETVKLMLTAGTAYSSHTNPSGHLQIDVSEYVQSICAAGTGG